MLKSPHPNIQKSAIKTGSKTGRKRKSVVIEDVEDEENLENIEV